MTRENVNVISQKLEKIMNDGSKNALWHETRRLSRNPALESLLMKNEQGQRIYDPKGIKELHAGYFQSLYKPKPPAARQRIMKQTGAKDSSPT